MTPPGGLLTVHLTPEQHAEVYRLVHDHQVMSAVLMSTRRLHPLLESEHRDRYAVWCSIVDVLAAVVEQRAPSEGEEMGGLSWD